MKNESQESYKGPYISRGCKINRSYQNPDMVIIETIRTGKFHTLTMSVQSMLLHYRPDPKPEKGSRKIDLSDLESQVNRQQGLKTFRAVNRPRGLAGIK